MQSYFSRGSLSNLFIIFLLYIPTVLIFYLAFTSDYVPLEKYESIRFVVLLLFAPIIFKYIIQLSFSPWYSVVEYVRNKKRSKEYAPSVSVIIPAWNEEVGVVKTVKSVINTEYPKLQIIIANDGSTDGTHEAVTGFIRSYQLENNSTTTKAVIDYIKLENGGKAKAMNAALKEVKNEITITVDADSVMDKNAIKNMVKHFFDPQVASVAGNVAIGNKTNFIGLAQQLEYLYGFYFKRADSLFNAVYIVGGAAAAYRTDVIRREGGFDEKIITEDIEISTRLQALGYYVRYAPNAVVYTEGPSDFIGLCRQRLRWKYGRFLAFYKHRELFFSLRKKHKTYLSFLILPIALFAEVLLFFEILLLIIFYSYTFYTNDFIPLAFVITLLTTVIIIQIISDPKTRYHRNLLLLGPIAWLLFYFIDLVEYQALIRSIKRFVSKSGLQWQKWNRSGISAKLIE
ncbi:MAG: glycosyltransferase family 2 protein [Candidatus Paceibacterota bacterium]